MPVPPQLRRSSNAAAAMRLAKNFDTTLSITAASPPTKAARVLAGTTFGAPAHAPDLRATTCAPHRPPRIGPSLPP